MKSWKRLLGFVAFVAALSACGASSEEVRYPAKGNAVESCRVHGAWCRWDDQCCSSRCYVDTGCSG
jgi:hypothetical protein